MGKVDKKKFYRPGTLEESGTKITLKTRPYTNGMVFDVEDPISSFRQKIALLKLAVNNLEILQQIAGVDNLIISKISTYDLGTLKLLLDYLEKSPIEIIIKEQVINKDILREIELNRWNITNLDITGGIVDGRN